MNQSLLSHLVGHGDDLGHGAELLDVGSLESLDHPIIVVDSAFPSVQISPGGKRLLLEQKQVKTNLTHFTSISA